MARKHPFDINTCARHNILSLEPYRCARDDYKDDGTNILLDANENAYGPGLPLDANGKLVDANKGINGLLDLDLRGLNRYPDPHQEELKSLLCALRNTGTHRDQALAPANLFVGVGSDEAIDALLRAFCMPGHDKLLTCPPTYGMYSVSATVNDVAVVKVPLREKNFSLDVPAIHAALSADPTIKLIYLCSPGNPTGTILSKDEINEVLSHPTWNGVVVIDEAYVDFSPPGSSLAQRVLEHPNLVVMQTLSKAFGLAGIRLGVAFCPKPIARLLNSLKAPYNISSPTSHIAKAALTPAALKVSSGYQEAILQQRDRMVRELPGVHPSVGALRGGLDANFLLVEMLDQPSGKPSNIVALKVYEQLAENRGVVVRFRGKEHGCLGCLRITVGTEDEVTRFLSELRSVLNSIYKEEDVASVLDRKKEEQEEVKANDVLA
ncbi:pyridoxal phosphate-dependent transferase [Lineolata rhizophorae]|uniref:histidinol-phosphate transaminase n=1 Tax=Lineolata rhizophorae TaxID=578093 RepID=A0A6A6P449_9PEZI|nr:pyridoxal phosphate-dependent transferase [Lineolata rhizophorae]